MAVSRVSTSSVLQGFPKSRSLLAGNSAYIPSSFESIATFTASGGETSITFTSIPSTYKHLQIRGQARVTIGGNFPTVFNMRFNSDSGSNYSKHSLTGDGSTVTASGAASQTQLLSIYIIGSGAAANIFAPSIIDILDYSSTSKNKTVKAFTGADANINTSDWQIALQSGAWLSTSAVNSILLGTDGFPIAAGSTFALYGIKG